MSKKELDIKELELLKTFFNNSADGIYVTDRHGKVLLANPSILEILEASYEEVIGLRLENILRSGVYKGSPSLEAMKTKKIFTGLVKTRSGSEIMSTSKPIFDKNGEVELVITNCRPVALIDSFLTEFIGDRRIKSRMLESTGDLTEEEENALICASQGMQRVKKIADTIANTDCSVVIEGQTGTGKGMMANYLHKKSYRRNKKFVDINCAALPENLMESELFGYEKGAFTGASSKGKVGLFEIAHGGTLFLDEIGEMPLHMQTKLLKVLDDGYVRRVGGTVYQKVNARIVVATNSNLREKVEEGSFREDLYYRLNVFNISIPPLKERKEDISPLSKKIVEELNHKYDDNKKITDYTITCFEKYDWPGNVRQLRNMVERLYVVNKEKEIDIENHRVFLGELEDKDNPIRVLEYPCKDNIDTKHSLKEYMDGVERQYIDAVIDKCNGSIPEAAELLGIHRTSLYKKIANR